MVLKLNIADKMFKSQYIFTYSNDSKLPDTILSQNSVRITDVSFVLKSIRFQSQRQKC